MPLGYYARDDQPQVEHGKDARVSVKAGVKNDACERPECPPNNLACVFTFVTMGYVVSYEWLHFSYHLPETHWLSRTRALSRLRRHHTLHHDLALMGKWNFNITFPICDAVLGTRYQE